MSQSLPTPAQTSAANDLLGPVGMLSQEEIRRRKKLLEAQSAAADALLKKMPIDRPVRGYDSPNVPGGFEPPQMYRPNVGMFGR